MRSDFSFKYTQLTIFLFLFLVVKRKVPRGATRVLYARDSIRKLCCIVNLELGNEELEDRPRRAKRHLRRIAGVMTMVAGAPRRAHAPEPAPKGTLSIGEEANTLTDRELLFERELKTAF